MIALRYALRNVTISPITPLQLPRRLRRKRYDLHYKEEPKNRIKAIPLEETMRILKS